MSSDVMFTVSEFVSVLNQTLEYAYPSVTVTGELANFKVSKNRWVYFDLKDEAASVRFFGTVYQLPGPLEDGMMLEVRGVPRLHPQFGFNVTVQSMRPTGEGSIKKAAKLLEAKLAAEGLFDPARKRLIPHPPISVGLITSAESAAYRDFMKVANARWGGLEITLIDVQVQGSASPAQITAAIHQFNELAAPPEVLVVTRGGGSSEDLQAFSTEQVTRAVAGSRIPTVVAIGHEVDISLAELAADQRASTPSNAAELLVPDQKAVLRELESSKQRLAHLTLGVAQGARQDLRHSRHLLHQAADRSLHQAHQSLVLHKQVLQAFNPQAALRRGYALVRKNGKLVQSGAQLAPGEIIQISLHDAEARASVEQVTQKIRE